LSHWQLQVLGIGTALKILFATSQKFKLERNEVIALVNTFGKFSHAIQIVQSMQAMQARRIWLRRTVIGLGAAFALLGLPLFVWHIVRRRRKWAEQQEAAAVDEDMNETDEVDADPKKSA